MVAASGPFANRITLGRLGRWRIVVELDGKTLSDTPIDVVDVDLVEEGRDRRVVASE